MFYSNNFGAYLNFVNHHEVLGQRNVFTIGLSPQVEDEHTQNYENLFGHPGATTARGEGISVIEAGEAELPSGDELASEIERFLRDQS